MRRIFTLLLFVSGALCRVNAQTYPVQATTQLLPPYSLFLADYVSAGGERLALNVYLADIARPSLDVRFRLRIVGQGITLETKAEYRPAPVQLQGGVPLRLVSTDLADYFNPNNLNFQGMSRTEFNRTGKLPEGAYQFCFEVLEYNRGVKISNTACAMAWLILNDPPIINLPANNVKLKAQDPQNVLLQWTPRHTGSPNAAFNTEYDVRMVEVWPATRNPNDAVLSSPAIFETTTTSTTVIYGPAETPLEPGRRYAFRVRARALAGLDEMDLFKNNGYSEVFTFVYGDPCDLPTGISINAISTTRFNLTWSSLFNHTGFRVRYRELGTANWYENRVTLSSSEITGLKPGTTYEYQVAATCGFYDGQYAAVARVTTEEAPETEYSCGVPIEAFNLDPAQLTGSLKVGDIINAGDFDVKLTKVSGSNGVFTGEGVIEVPYFNRAKVKTEFTNITVNKELRMVNGHLNVTGAGVDVIPQGVTDFIEDLNETLDDIEGGLDTIEENLPESFDPESFVPDTLIDVKGGVHSVYTNEDKSVVIVYKNGNTQTLPPGTTAAIKDDNGKGYLVDSKGKVHETTSDVATKAGNRELNLKLKFVRYADSKNGFDMAAAPSLAKDYEQLKGGYPVAWKSVPVGGMDPVQATVEGIGIDKNKIRFEMGGMPVSVEPMDGVATKVLVQGSAEGDELGLLALYTPSDSAKDQVLGKLNVATYNEIVKSVVIVPVGNVSLPSSLTVDKISLELNKIYGQAVVRWNVSMADPIPYTLPSPFDEGETGLLTNYTGDMKDVIRAFGPLQDETFYLFLVSRPKNNQTLGYMPRGKQAGFIFVDRHGEDGDAIGRTMAHELGHGAFNLHHTFKEPNFTLAQGMTDNLMDYPMGDKLYKYQWDKMRYPDIVVGLFEEDEEGEGVNVMVDVFEEFEVDEDATVDASTLPPVTCDGYTFLTRKGRLITLSEDIAKKISTYHMSGRYLTAVTTKDGKKFAVGTSYITTKLDKPISIGGKTLTKEITNSVVSLKCTCLAGQYDVLLKPKEVKAYNKDEAEKVYELPAVYKLAISKQVECAVGVVFVTRVMTDGKLVCDKVNQADCEGSKSGNGDGNINTVVQNFSKQSLQNIESLKKLLAGLKPAPGNRHFSKAKLFLTDEPLRLEDPEKYKFVENYQPTGDTIKIWLHHNGIAWELKSDVTKNAEKLAQLYAENGYALAVKDLIKSYKDTEADKIATALYEFFDWVAKGVEKAKIPEYIWNCDKADEYESIYATVYGWVTAPLKPVRMIVQEQFKILLQNDPDNAVLLQKLQNMEQIELAAICGLWDGLVDIVAGVPQMLKLISGLASSKGWAEMSKTYETLSTYSNPESGRTGIMGALKDGISDMFNPQKPCELAHNTSGIVVGIALCFINPAAIEGSFGKVIANFVKVVQRIDAIADKLNPLTTVAGKVSKMAFQSVGNVFTTTIKGSKLVLKVASRMGEPFQAIDWSRWTKRVPVASMAMVGGGSMPFGQMRLAADFGAIQDQMKDGVLRIKRIVQDEKGKIFTDAEGNGILELENGKRVVAKVSDQVIEDAMKLLRSKFPDVSEDVLQKVAERNLDNLESFLNNADLISHIKKSGYAERFLDDLTKTWGDTKVIGNALDEVNEEIFDRWKTFMSLSDEAGGVGSSKRLDIEYLKNTENPADDFGMPSNKRNAQMMVDEYQCQSCKDALEARAAINKNTKNLMDKFGDTEDLIVNGSGRKVNWADVYEQAGYPRKKPGETWEKYFASLEENFNEFQAHHIFPAELFSTSEGFRFYFKNYNGPGKLDFNAASGTAAARKNTIMVEAFKHGDGLHTNHFDYTERIQQHLDAVYQTARKKGWNTDRIANHMHKEIDALADKLKAAIIDQGMIDVNSLLKQSNKHINDLDFSTIL